MEGSIKGATIKPETKIRVEFLFEKLKEKENLTIEDCLALAGFLVSLVGLMTNVKLIRAIAGHIYSIIDDANEHFPSILQFKLAETDGIPHRPNVDRKDGEVPTNTIEQQRDNNNI